MAIKIEQDRVVTLAYRLTDHEGHLHEEKTPENPYEYLHGRGSIVAPVERAIHGKTPGFTAEVSVSPREGFGEYDPSLVAQVPLSSFPPAQVPRVGMKFDTHDARDRVITVRVIEVDDSWATVDGNHPLAGMEVIFELRVLDVREATLEEIAAGHVGAKPMPPGSDFGSLH